MDSFFEAIRRALYFLFNDSIMSIVFTIIVVVGIITSFVKSFK